MRHVFTAKAIFLPAEVENFFRKDMEIINILCYNQIREISYMQNKQEEHHYERTKY